MAEPLIIWERDIAMEKYPPVPYLEWSEAAIKKYLVNKGFDLDKEIVKLTDEQGNRWIQNG